MDFELGFLAGMGFWPITLLFLWAILLFPLVEFERIGFAILTVVIGLALAQFAFGYNVIGYIVNNPITLIAWAGGYVITGIGYSLLRWDRLCAKWRANYDHAATNHGATVAKRVYWKERPNASESKNRITSWMIFWPWSAFWWVFSDLITQVFEWIYQRFSSVYVRIAERHIKAAVPPDDYKEDQ